MNGRRPKDSLYRPAPAAEHGTLTCPPSSASHADVATDQLLDFGDGVNVESNGNVEGDQRPSETDDNPRCVRPPSSGSV